MTLVHHLRELRKRLIISIVAVVIGAIAGFSLWDWVLDITTKPYCTAQAKRGISAVAGGSACQLYISSPVELFTTRMTVGVYIGLLLASPIVLWQIWRFVTPGLHDNEKRYAVPFMACSIVLFLSGVAIAWLSFPLTIQFFLAVGGQHIQTLFNPAPYLKLIFLMMVVFGAVFEIPILLVFLQLLGIVSSKQLSQVRRYAIVANTIIGAVATPSQDPYSMLMLAIPLCVFYEIAILVGKAFKK